MSESTPTVAASAGAPSTGETILAVLGDYTLLEEVARGGMGVVYRAEQRGLGRTVAIKRILKGHLASEEEIQRFRVEAEAAATLDHPHIVPIYEIGETEGQPFYVMKFVDGGGLGQHLPRYRQDPRAAAQLMATIARAVHHAHQRGILHRDLKPGNILLDREGQPYVTDFGLARRLEGQVGMTQTGVIVGTPEYMAPEQARAQKSLTTAVDVYALGGILYTLLGGSPPFKRENILETLMQVIDAPVPSLRARHAELPRDLELICLKCLEKDPGRRYESAEALALDLERWLDHVPIQARPASTVERFMLWCRRQPALAATSALAILGVVLGLVLSLLFALEQANSAAALRDKGEELSDALATSERRGTELVKINQKRREALESAARLALGRHRALVQDRQEMQGLLWLGRALELLPEESRELHADLRRSVALWSEQSPKVRSILSAHDTNDCTWFQLSPDGKILLTRGNLTPTGGPRLWRTDTGAPIGNPLWQGSSGRDTAFHWDKTELVSVRRGKDHYRLERWDLTTGRAVGEAVKLPVAEMVPQAAPLFSPRGKYLVLTEKPGFFRVWDGKTGKATTGLISVGAAHAEAGDLHEAMFSPDELLLFLARRPVGRASRPGQPPDDLQHATFYECLWLPGGQVLQGSILTDPRPSFLSSDPFRFYTFAPRGRAMMVLSSRGARAQREEVAGLMFPPNGPFNVHWRFTQLRSPPRCVIGNGTLGFFHLLSPTAPRGPVAWHLLLFDLKNPTSESTILPAPPLSGWSPSFERTFEQRLPQFSPAGDRILTVQNERAVLWHKGVFTTLETPEMPVLARFHPTSDLLATAGGERVELWEVSTGRRRGGAFLHPGPVTQLDWLPGEETLVVRYMVAGQSEIRLWDVGRPRPQATLRLPGGTFAEAFSSHEGNELLVRTHNVPGGDSLDSFYRWRLMPGASEPVPTRAQWLADKNALLVHQRERRLAMPTVASPLEGRMPEDSRVVASYSPDGRHVITWQTSPRETTASLQVWTATGTLRHTMSLARTEAPRFAFARDGTTVLIEIQNGNRSQTVAEWQILDLESGKLTSLNPYLVPPRGGDRGEPVAQPVPGLAQLTPEGRTVLYPTAKGEVFALDWVRGTSRLVASGLGRIEALVFRSDGREELCVSDVKGASFWDLKEGKRSRVELDAELWSRVTPSLDGGMLLQQEDRSGTRLALWDVAEQRRVGQAIAVERAQEWCMSPDSELLLVYDAVLSSSHRPGRLYNLRTGELLRKDLPAGLPSFTPDSQRIVFRGKNLTHLDVWERGSDKLSTFTIKHNLLNGGFSFSADSQYLLTSGTGESLGSLTIEVYELRTGKRIRAVPCQSTGADSGLALGERTLVHYTNRGLPFPLAGKRVSPGSGLSHFTRYDLEGKVLAQGQFDTPVPAFPTAETLVCESRLERIPLLWQLRGNEFKATPWPELRDQGTVHWLPGDTRLLTRMPGKDGRTQIDRLWAVHTRQPLGEPWSSDWPVLVSTDGQWLLRRGTEQGSQEILDTSTGKVAFQFSWFGGEVSAWKVLPEAKRCWTLNRSVRGYESQVWDLATGKLVRTDPAVDRTTAHFSSEGKYLLQINPNGVSKATIELVELATGQGKLSTQGTWANFSPDGKQVWTIGGPSNDRMLLQRWSLEGKSLGEAIPVVRSIGWNEHTPAILRRTDVNNSSKLELCDPATGKAVGKLALGYNSSAAYTLSRDATWLAVTRGDTKSWHATLYHTPTGRMIPLVNNQPGRLNGLFFVPGKARLWTRTLEQNAQDQITFHLWDLEKGQLVRQIGPVTSGGVTINLGSVSTISRGGYTILYQLWDLVEGTPRAPAVRATSRESKPLDTSKSGEFLIETIEQRQTRVCDFFTGKAQGPEFVSNPGERMLLSPRGDWLLRLQRSQTTRQDRFLLHEVRTGKTLGEEDFPDQLIQHVWFEGQGETFVVVAGTPPGMGQASAVAQRWSTSPLKRSGPAIKLDSSWMEPTGILLLSADGTHLSLQVPRQSTVRPGDLSTFSLYDAQTLRRLSVGFPGLLGRIDHRSDSNRPLLAQPAMETQVRTTFEGKPHGAPILLPAWIGPENYIPGRPVPVTFQVSPDGKTLVLVSSEFGGSNLSLSVWDVLTGTMRHGGEPIGGMPEQIVFRPDGTTFVTVGKHWGAGIRDVNFWDLQSGKKIEPMNQRTAGVSLLAVHPTSDEAIYLTEKATVQLRDRETDRPLGPELVTTFAGRPIPTDRDGQLGILFVPREKRWEGYVTNLRTGERQGEPLRLPVSAVMSPTGESVVFPVDPRGTRWMLYHLQKRHPIGEDLQLSQPLQKDFLAVKALYSPDGQRLVLASETELQLFDATTGKPQGKPLLFKPAPPGWSTPPPGFSPTGKFLMRGEISAGAEFFTVHLLDARTGEAVLPPQRLKGEQLKRATFGFTAKDHLAWFLGLDPQKRTVARLAVWDLREQKERFVLECDSALMGAPVFTAEGTQFFFAERCWETQTGQQRGTRLPGSGPLAAFSPEGRFLLTGNERTIQLWDIAQGRALGGAISLEGTVREVAFWPERRAFRATTLLPKNEGSRLHVWPLPQPWDEAPERISARLQRQVGMILDPEGIVRPVEASSWQQAPR